MRHGMMFGIAALWLGAAAFGQSTYYVSRDCTPPGVGTEEEPFCTVQEGIDAAVDGDTVIVGDGFYLSETSDFGGKAVTVRSANGPAGCIFRGAFPEGCLRFAQGEGPASVLEGITIDGHNSADDRCGIYCENASPTISHCVVIGAGVGIAVAGGSPTISDCTISYTTVSGIKSQSGSPLVEDCVFMWNGGKGVNAEGGTPTIRNCSFTANQSVSVYAEGGTPAIRNCYFTANKDTAIQWAGTDGSLTVDHCLMWANLGSLGGALSCAGAPATIVNSYVLSNTAPEGGGIYATGPVAIRNCTLASNAGGLGATLRCAEGAVVDVVNTILGGGLDAISVAEAASLSVRYSAVAGGCVGEGNLDADPGMTRDGHHLLATSPCRDAGDPNGDYAGMTDRDGEPRLAGDRVDIGADEFIDTDGDGLPDVWELAYFDSPTAAAPDDDPDGDGLVHRDEYARSRHPLEPPVAFYVDPDGNDTWDGLSATWDGTHGPKATVQAGIDAAKRYEGDEVVLADGTYRGVGNYEISLDGKAITLRSAHGRENCIICTGQPTLPWNFFPAFFLDHGEGPDTVIEGLTIQAEKGPSAAWANVGRGITVYGSSPIIRDCTIRGFTSTNAHGGGILCAYGRAQIIGCTICENMAYYPQGVPSAWGGGIHLLGGNPTLRGCIITGNRADTGAGVGCDGGAPTIIDCAIADNRSYAPAVGGGVRVRGAQLTIDRCAIIGNWNDGIWADYRNAETLHLMPGFVVVRDTLISGNGRRGLSSHRVQLTRLENCTIATNGRNEPCGISYVRTSESQLELTNCILFGSESEEDSSYFGYMPDPDNLTIRYCTIAGEWPGEGNIDVDPGFVAFGHWGTASGGSPPPWIPGDYRLRAASPCRDAGDPEFEAAPGQTDLDGRPRVRCGRVDMGAYEAGAADADCDHDVDLFDFAGFQNCFTGEAGTPPDDTCENLDADADGDVDLDDLAAFGTQLVQG